MAERAVRTVAEIAADAAQAPSRLGHATDLLTGDGQLGSLWQVMAPFAGLLLGAAGVALTVHRLLSPSDEHSLHLGRRARHHSCWDCCIRCS
jgi:hypothetical protein